MNAQAIAKFATAVLFSAAAAAHAGDIPQPYGTPVQTESAQREIKIQSATRYVNVERGETVRFVTPQGAFVWNFDTDRNRSQFDFAQIVPQAVSGNGIRVFVGDAASDR